VIEVVRQKPKSRPFRNGECVRLVALRDGRPVFSLTTGVDRRYVRLTGEKRGWFSDIAGEDDPEAARAVFQEATAFQRSLRLRRMSGPDAPDGRFHPGLPVTGSDAAPHLERLLLDNGFRVSRSYAAFRVSADSLPGMRRAAERARTRHGFEVRRMGFHKASCRAVYELYEPKRVPFEEFAEILSSMRPLELYVVSRRGADAGFALTRREGGAQRVETVMIAPGFRRGPALLCLMDALRERLGPDALTGAIDRENEPSIRMVQALGGEVYAQWREYDFDLI
jgi:hypothetical protein